MSERRVGRSRAAAGVCSVVLLAAFGCAHYPRDPEGTLDRIRGSDLRAGTIVSEPWTVAGDPPGGIEADLVRELAAELGAEVKWFEGDAQELFPALHERELDIVIGGLVRTDPWSARVTFTHPYLTTQMVVGFPPSWREGPEIAGVEVLVEEATEQAGILAKTDAVVVPVQRIGAPDRPAVVDDWLLDELGLEDRGVTLVERDHVMAVASGENAWLTRVERFLLERHDQIERALGAVEP